LGGWDGAEGKWELLMRWKMTSNWKLRKKFAFKRKIFWLVTERETKLDFCDKLNNKYIFWIFFKDSDEMQINGEWKKQRIIEMKLSFFLKNEDRIVGFIDCLVFVKIN